MDINKISVFSVTEWKNKINTMTYTRKNKKGTPVVKKYALSFR